MAFWGYGWIVCVFIYTAPACLLGRWIGSECVEYSNNICICSHFLCVLLFLFLTMFNTLAAFHCGYYIQLHFIPGYEFH